MRFARSRFNNRAALLGTPIGTKVALRSAATMPTMSERARIQKIADSLEHAPEVVRWEVATDLAFCLIGRSCEESVQSLLASRRSRIVWRTLLWMCAGRLLSTWRAAS